MGLAYATFHARTAHAWDHRVQPFTFVSLVFIFFVFVVFSGFFSLLLSLLFQPEPSEIVVPEGSGLFIRSHGTIIITGTRR